MHRRPTEDSQSAIAPLLIILAAVPVVLALPTAAAGPPMQSTARPPNQVQAGG